MLYFVQKHIRELAIYIYTYIYLFQTYLGYHTQFLSLKMVQVNRNVASFITIIEILQNDQRKIKLIRKYENTQKR